MFSLSLSLFLSGEVPPPHRAVAHPFARGVYGGGVLRFPTSAVQERTINQLVMVLCHMYVTRVHVQQSALLSSPGPLSFKLPGGFSRGSQLGPEVHTNTT